MKRPFKYIQKQTGLRILAEVAARYGIKTESMIAKNRKAKVNRARTEFYRLAHAAGVGPTMICKILGRDMSTVLYHVNDEFRRSKCAKRSEYDKIRSLRPCTTRTSDETASSV